MAGSRVTPNLNLTGKWASVCGLSVDEGRFSPVGFNVLARKAIQFTEKSQPRHLFRHFLFVTASLKNEILPSLNKSQSNRSVYWCMTNSHRKLVFCFKRSILIGKITSDDPERRSADFLTSVVDCFVVVFFAVEVLSFIIQVNQAVAVICITLCSAVIWRRTPFSTPHLQSVKQMNYCRTKIKQ